MGATRKIALSVVVVAFVFHCLLADWASAQEKLSEGDRAILDKLDKLQESVDELKLRVKALEGKLSSIQPAAPAPEVSPWWPRGRRGPDLAKLKKIVLPKDASKEQVREYLYQIRRASSLQNVWGSDDPQVAMIAAVGAENVDVLLHCLSERGASDIYIMGALKAIVGPQHKDLILEHLARSHQLVEFVIAEGWVKDARDTLVNELRLRPRLLPRQWIDAVARFEDPATYDDLKWYLIHGSNPEETYQAIRNLAAMDLEETVPKAWEQKKYGEQYEAFQMAKVAVRFGNVEALGEILRNAAEGDEWSASEARSLVWRLTGQAGSSRELIEWFNKNKDRLVFDPKAGTFSVKAGEESEK